MNRVSPPSSVLMDLNEIATILSRSIMEQPLREVFQAITAKLVALLAVDHSTITLLDDGRQYFRVEAEYPQLPTRLVGERIPVQGRTTQLGLLNRQEPVVADDLSEHTLTIESTSFRQIVQALDIRSLMIVAMVTDGDTIGTISVDTIGRTKSFTKEELALCQSIANQLAAFVASVRLRDEHQKYRRQADLIVSHPARAGASSTEAKVVRPLFAELQKVIQFKKASLQLIVDGKRILVGAFGFDPAYPHPWLLRPVESDPVIRDIVQGRRPMILSNTAAAAGWEKQADTADVNSWIGMPLLFRGETIGLLTLDHDQVGFYANIPENVLARLDELTHQAAQDLWAAYSLEVAQRQIKALEIVRQFAETVATKLNPKDVLLTVVSLISRGLGCRRCNVFLAEPREGREALVCQAVCQGTSCEIVEGLVLPTPHHGQLPCPVHLAFQNGDSILIDDREQDSHHDFSHQLYDDARSMIAVPLKIANQIIGAVLVLHDRPGWFGDADRLLLETLARQAANAIERDYGLELIHSIGNKILEATEVDAVLKDVVSGAMKLIHTDSGVIYELDEGCTEVIRSYKPEGSIHPRPRLHDPQSITRTVIARKTMLEIPDIEKDSRVNPDLRGRYRSMFAVPLLLGQSVVGVLYLNGKSVRELTDTERSLLDTLAGQAALAIQRTRLHEQIRDSDAMYRSLVDHIPQFVFRKDKNSLFTWANRSFCQSLGRRLDEIRGRSDCDFYPKEDAEKYIRGDQEVMETKQPLTFDEGHKPPGGKQRMLVRAVKTPVLDANGEVTGVQAIFWDITKEVEEREMAQRWRSLAEQSPDGIVVHEGGRITLANPAAVRLFGANSSDELKGHSILDFLDESSRPLAKRRLEKLARGDDVEPMAEMRVLRGPDGKVDVEVYTRCVPGTNEIQAVFHDLTRTRRLLQEMHHRVLGSLNQIKGFLTRQEEFTKAPEVLHAFDTLRDRIQAVALVHQILYGTARESDVEMDLYLTKLREALLRAQDSPGLIALDFSAPGVILNEKQATACGLIITELVSNSLRHAFPRGSCSDRGARVSVSLSSDGNVLRLMVSDNGVGMETSGQLSESMGLSLVRNLVSHDLKGTVEEETGGAGTCFTIKFQCPRNGKDARHGT